MQTNPGRRVISANNLPFRMPLWQTIALLLLLERLGAPPFVWGVVGVLLLFCWIVFIYDALTRVSVDILTNQKRHREE